MTEATHFPTCSVKWKSGPMGTEFGATVLTQLGEFTTSDQKIAPIKRIFMFIDKNTRAEDLSIATGDKDAKYFIPTEALELVLNAQPRVVVAINFLEASAWCIFGVHQNVVRVFSLQVDESARKRGYGGVMIHLAKQWGALQGRVPVVIQHTDFKCQFLLDRGFVSRGSFSSSSSSSSETYTFKTKLVISSAPTATHMNLHPQAAQTILKGIVDASNTTVVPGASATKRGRDETQEHDAKEAPVRQVVLLQALVGGNHAAYFAVAHNSGSSFRKSLNKCAVAFASVLPQFRGQGVLGELVHAIRKHLAAKLGSIALVKSTVFVDETGNQFQLPIEDIGAIRLPLFISDATEWTGLSRVLYRRDILRNAFVFNFVFSGEKHTLTINKIPQIKRTGTAPQCSEVFLPLSVKHHITEISIPQSKKAEIKSVARALVGFVNLSYRSAHMPAQSADDVVAHLSGGRGPVTFRFSVASRQSKSTDGQLLAFSTTFATHETETVAQQGDVAHSGDATQLAALFVHPAFQRMGLATELVNVAVKSVEGNNGTIEIPFDAINTRAEKFYEERGFTIEDEVDEFSKTRMMTRWAKLRTVVPGMQVGAARRQKIALV